MNSRMTSKDTLNLLINTASSSWHIVMETVGATNISTTPIIAVASQGDLLHTNKRFYFELIMRLTASGVFTRPAPVPKMPNGLVELMEGLTREVLKQNPSNIYEFCANHMQELILIRDGRAPNRLTLDQKIKRAQEKIRQRADERRRKYDEDAKKCGVVLPQACESTQDDKISDSSKEPHTKTKEQEDTFDLMEIKGFNEVKVKTPIHHEKDITDALEVEIFHKIKEEGDKADKSLSLTDITETVQTDISNIGKTVLGSENPIVESNISDVVSSENNSCDLDSIFYAESIVDDNKSSSKDNLVETKDFDKKQIIETKNIISAGIADNQNSVDTIREKSREIEENTIFEHSDEIVLEQIEIDSDNKTTDFIDKNITIVDPCGETKLNELKFDKENKVEKNEITEHSINNSQNDQPAAPLETYNLSQGEISYQKTEKKVDNEINLEKEEANTKLITHTNTNSVTEKIADQITSIDGVKVNEVGKDFLISDTSAKNNIGTDNNILDESSKNIVNKNDIVSLDSNSEIGDDSNISVPKTLEYNMDVQNVIDNNDNNAIDTLNTVNRAFNISDTSNYVEKTKSISNEATENTEESVRISDQINVQSQGNTDNELTMLMANLSKHSCSVETSEKPDFVSTNNLSDVESIQSTNPVLEGLFVRNVTEKNQLEIHSLLELEGKECKDHIANRNFDGDVLTTVDKVKSDESTLLKIDNKSIPNQLAEEENTNGQISDENKETEDKINNEPDLKKCSELLEFDLDERNVGYRGIKHEMTDLSLTKTDSAVTQQIDSVPENENVDPMEHVAIVDNILKMDGHKSSTDLSEIKSNANSMDLETAAITIQKEFRSFLFKKGSTFDDTNIDNSSIDDDSSKVEVDFLTSTPPVLNKERRTLGLSRMDTVLQTVNEEKSLSQSTDDSSLSSAATIIQAHVRGFLVRNRLNSNKTNSTSLVNSEGPSTSLEGEEDQKANKTVLNIHIVPQGEHFLSRDESLLTSIDLSLDGSPPSSTNLHPLGYDKSEPRKQLKREDAIQSVSPPSNNSGKLSEDVDSVKDMVVSDSEQQKNIESVVSQTRQEADLDSRDDTPTKSTTVETVIEAHKIVRDSSSSPETEQNNTFVKSLIALGTDEHDVITPSGDRRSLSSDDTLRLLHSGEFHDVVLPTKISRTDTTVVRGE